MVAAHREAHRVIEAREMFNTAMAALRVGKGVSGGRNRLEGMPGKGKGKGKGHLESP
jgi:hypothetical protein